MCNECYVDNNRITPIVNPHDCLKNHEQYVCGSCGRCICIARAPKTGLQRWHFPFKTLEIAKCYLRTADFTMKKSCFIYEIEDVKGRMSYKIFSDRETLQLFLKKNSKSCRNVLHPFFMKEYREFPDTKIKKLTSFEIDKYMSNKN